MTTRLTLSALAVLTAGFTFAQGSLTPSGAPSATMKTLNQVEPRIPISQPGTIISEPGSYYLVSNIVCSWHGVIITTDNVTLDLMGFTLSGDEDEYDYGIFLDGVINNTNLNVIVRNGTIRHFDTGIFAEYSVGCRFEKLMIVDNLYNGVHFYGNGVCFGHTIVDCTVSGNGYVGIELDGRNVRCDDNKIIDCTISRNSGMGVYLNGAYGQCDNNSITGCAITENEYQGIYLGGYSGSCEGNVVANCIINNNSNDGVFILYSNRNRIENNQLMDNVGGLGISQGLNNCVADNRVVGNGDNYALAEGNQLNLLISEIPESLDWSCSAKLAGSLHSNGHGVSITADDVTLDLNGFAISGDRSGTDYGIYLEGATNSLIHNVVVRNGMVNNFRTGIRANYVEGCRFENLMVSDNTYIGIRLHGNTGQCDGNMIASCIFRGNIDSGVFFSAYSGQCDGNTLSGCTIYGNDDYGVYLDGSGGGQCDGNLITGCMIEKNANRGIYLQYADGNRLEGNNVSSQIGTTTYGIYTLGTSKNMIFRNTCVGQTDNYHLDVDDVFGPEVSSTGALPSTGDGAHPLANFSY